MKTATVSAAVIYCIFGLKSAQAIPPGTMDLSGFEKALPVITVRDFAIDGPRFARANKTVKVEGAYIVVGQSEYLYADSQAVIAALNCRGCGRQPNIPLLTENASRAIRERLLSCQEDPSASQIGCSVTLYGTIETCTATSVFGAKTEAPCLDVMDGQ